MHNFVSGAEIILLALIVGELAQRNAREEGENRPSFSEVAFVIFFAVVGVLILFSGVGEAVVEVIEVFFN